MKKNIITCLILFIFISGAFTASYAENFTIMTEEYPPFNYTENGNLTGLSTEVMAELTKRVGHENNTEVLPWSRAYNLIQKKDNMILFSMTRTEQRENLFKWVGPVASNQWVFFAKKDSGLTISSLEDAKKVNKIGAYKDDAAESFLKDNGFTNIDSVVDDLANVKKLNAGRIDLWIVGHLQGLYKVKTMIGDTSAFEKLYDIKMTQLYIAFSKKTPDSIITKWQTELDKMKNDGTYDTILKKYM